MNRVWRPKRTSPEGGTTNNEDRAKTAERACAAAAFARGDMFDAEDPSIVTDLIADLCHLCDREGWDAEELIRSALMNWQGPAYGANNT